MALTPSENNQYSIINTHSMPNGHWSIDTWMIIERWVLDIVSVSEKKRGDDTDAWTEYVIASEAKQSPHAQRDCRGRFTPSQ